MTIDSQMGLFAGGDAMTIDLQLEKEELQKLVSIVYSEFDRINDNEESTKSVFNLIMKLIKYLPQELP